MTERSLKKENLKYRGRDNLLFRGCGSNLYPDRRFYNSKFRVSCVLIDYDKWTSSNTNYGGTGVNSETHITYPYPELCTIGLFGVGLLTLVGYIRYSRRTLKLSVEKLSLFYFSCSSFAILGEAVFLELCFEFPAGNVVTTCSCFISAWDLPRLEGERVYKTRKIRKVT